MSWEAVHKKLLAGLAGLIFLLATAWAEAIHSKVETLSIDKPLIQYRLDQIDKKLSNIEKKLEAIQQANRRFPDMEVAQ